MTTEAVTTDAGDGEVVSVTGSTIGLEGRFLISTANNQFITDAKVAEGGPSQAVRAGELLLSALASCALSIIQEHAQERGVALGRARVTALFKRDINDSTRYAYIRLLVRFDDVDTELGAQLVKEFTDRCPIYNTLRRGGIVQIEIEKPDEAQRQHATAGRGKGRRHESEIPSPPYFFP